MVVRALWVSITNTNFLPTGGGAEPPIEPALPGPPEGPEKSILLHGNEEGFEACFS